jgi:hypothetical protein
MGPGSNESGIGEVRTLDTGGEAANGHTPASKPAEARMACTGRGFSLIARTFLELKTLLLNG